MALSIEPAEGQQTTTSNPQTLPTQTIGASAKSGGVQPGTAASLLNSQQGVSLGNPDLTTVNLGPATQTQTAASPRPAQPARHSINATWLGIPVILVLVAVGTFWIMHRSAKSTTY